MKMKSSSSKASGLRKPCYNAGGLVSFRDEQNADGRADSFMELADPERIKKLAVGTDRIDSAFKDGKMFSNMANNFAARDQFIRGRNDPSVMQLNGMKKGGVIGDVKNDKGEDTIDAKVRPGEYMLNPETVAEHFGGGDHALGVRNLNNIVRSATGREPGATMVDGKSGYANSSEVKPMSGLRPGSALAVQAFPDTTPKPVDTPASVPTPTLAGQARAGSMLANMAQNQAIANPPASAKPAVISTPAPAPKTEPISSPGLAEAPKTTTPTNTGVRVPPPVDPQSKFNYAGKDELGHHVYLGADGKPLTKIFKGGDSHGLIQYDPSGMNPADPKELARAIALSGNATKDAQTAATNVLQSEATSQHYKAAEETAKANAIRNALALGKKGRGDNNDIDEAFKQYKPVQDKEGNTKYIEDPVASAKLRNNVGLILRSRNIDPGSLSEDEMRSYISALAPELDLFSNLQAGQLNEKLPVSDLPVDESGNLITGSLRRKRMSLLDPLSANVDVADLFGGGDTIVDSAGNPLGTTTGRATSLARGDTGVLGARGVRSLQGLPFLN